MPDDHHYRAMNRATGTLLTVLLTTLTFACGAPPSVPKPAGAPVVPDRSVYWHQGKAEVSRFDLQQVRYGSIYSGVAVMIFVKEDFLPGAQVKHEGRSAAETPVPVLKLIATRDFLTGLYPYSLMTTVFSPFRAGDGRSYKITATTQDWCGQTFMQLNNRDSLFAVAYRSYFEEEGDRDFAVPPAVLEDELFTIVRTDPARLPLGEVRVLPSLHCVQLRIKDFHEHTGTAAVSTRLLPELARDSVRVYAIRYHDVPREFSITFEATFPHAILAWEETEGELKKGKRPMTTRGVRTHTMLTDYWNRSAPADSVLRKGLGL